MSNRFGGFLLHWGCACRALARGLASDHPSTGKGFPLEKPDRVPRGQNVFRGMDVRVFGVATGHALELGL